MLSFFKSTQLKNNMLLSKKKKNTRFWILVLIPLLLPYYYYHALTSKGQKNIFYLPTNRDKYRFARRHIIYTVGLLLVDLLNLSFYERTSNGKSMHVSRLCRYTYFSANAIKFSFLLTKIKTTLPRSIISLFLIEVYQNVEVL